VVGITGRVRVVEQDLQCSADRADEGSHKRRRADLFQLAGERLLQVPGDLALGVELDLQDAHPDSGHGPDRLQSHRRARVHHVVCRLAGAG
jgi:hypothetical protein